MMNLLHADIPAGTQVWCVYGFRVVSGIVRHQTRYGQLVRRRDGTGDVMYDNEFGVWSTEVEAVEAVLHYRIRNAEKHQQRVQREFAEVRQLQQRLRELQMVVA